MEQSDPKQKAFAQRVYFDLKMCRQWPTVRVHFYETKKWIFFVGTPSHDQPLRFVLPISSDEQLNVDELFTLVTRLNSALSLENEEKIQSVLMGIVANDFTLAYFNVSSGIQQPQICTSMPGQEENSTPSLVDNEPIVEIEKETDNEQWTTTDSDAVWN